jgi:hypothetical protein
MLVERLHNLAYVLSLGTGVVSTLVFCGAFSVMLADSSPIKDDDDLLLAAWSFVIAFVTLSIAYLIH